jgi:hypothetical protein
VSGEYLGAGGIPPFRTTEREFTVSQFKKFLPALLFVAGIIVGVLSSHKPMPVRRERTDSVSETERLSAVVVQDGPGGKSFRVDDDGRVYIFVATTDPYVLRVQ